MNNENAPLKGNFFRGIKAAGIAYFSAGTILYFFQEKIMLRPKKLPAGYRFRFDIPFAEIDIPFNSYNLSLVKFNAASPVPKGVILYFHGNRDNINRYAKYAPHFTRHGYEVWIMDYPGYGKSTGIFSEETVYEQALLIYNMARQKFTEENIIVYGKSLGSGIASWLASVKNCYHLILETPYYSVPDLFRTYAPIYPIKAMTKFKFPTGDHLKKVQVPVTIFHGTNDRVIPYDCAAKLKMVLKAGDEFVTINNGSHNDLNEFSLFHEKLTSVLSFE